MGIPSYFSYIVKNHPNIIQRFAQNSFRVHNLYLDCNSIIYDIVAKFDYTIKRNLNKSIISCVISKIEDYIKDINPSETVYIAFDGVAPVAKLDQQRSRRFKSNYQNNIHKQIFNKEENDAFNTTSITPGTNFMHELCADMYSHFESRNVASVKNVIVSCSDSPGEGEHKLFQYIRDEPEKHFNETTVIYGLDADLIMLSLNHLPLCPHIYLFRETPEFIKSIDSSLSPNELYVLDIYELSKNIGGNMMQPNVVPCAEKTNSLVYDYIFICFFLGNDFMPHFPALNIRTGGVNKVLDAYKETIGTSATEVLVNGDKIYWNNVLKFVENLKKKELLYIQNEIKLRDSRSRHQRTPETPEQAFAKFENSPTFDRDLEKRVNPFKTFWQKRYYNALLNMDPVDDMRVKQISMNYLEGLEWTFKYYTKGCPNWRWTYKHNYPPLLEDLCKYIPIFDTELVPYVEPNPVDSLTQLCYVIPLSALDLLPSKLYHALTRDKPNWYSKNAVFVWAFCRYFWESHTDLPEIDINELETFIELYKKNNITLL
jgi:5'-3' exoribonuclease 1